MGRALWVERVCVSGTTAALLAAARPGFGKRQERRQIDAAGACWPGSSALDSDPSTAGLLSFFSASSGLWTGRDSAQIVGLDFPAGWRRDSSGGRNWAVGRYYGWAAVGMEGWKDAAKARGSAVRTRKNGR